MKNIIVQVAYPTMSAIVWLIGLAILIIASPAMIVIGAAQCMGEGWGDGLSMLRQLRWRP